MSNTPIQVNQSLEDVLKQINQKLDRVQEDVNEMSVRLVKVETKLDAWKPSIDKIPDLAEKVGELKNWRQIAFVTITASIGGIVGWFARSGKM